MWSIDRLAHSWWIASSNRHRIEHDGPGGGQRSTVADHARRTAPGTVAFRYSTAW